ncbi:hypothetical protein AB3S75_033707 [Citrus x aurantiifolia]
MSASSGLPLSFLSFACLLPWCGNYWLSMASLSMIFYIFLQFIHTFLSFGSQSWNMHYIKSLFDTAWINIQICCGQILFWPILLQVNDLSRVEYAEKAALPKHSMWSSLAVDVLLVNLIGFSLLFYAESVCLWVLELCQ